MFWQRDEVTEILRMIENEHLDIRTVTMGVSLRGLAHPSAEHACAAIREHLQRTADQLVPTIDAIQADYAVPITNKRLSVTPIALIAESAQSSDYVPFAQAMDRAAAEVGVDYIGGFSALVQKGMTPGDRNLIDAIPRALSTTERVCSSINVATTRAGINVDAINLMAAQVKALAEATADQGGIGCAKLVIFANIPDDNPFIAGAMHGIGEAATVINVGVSGPGVVLSTLKRLFRHQPRCRLDEVADAIKRTAFKVTRAGELIGREVVRRLGDRVRFGVVDLSLAPTPAIGDSVAEILEELGLQRAGAPGSTAALALLTDAVKKGGMMASSAVGGLSGAFIPVSEDAAMVAAVREGALSLEKLEAMTAVCSVGLDMVAVPGDTSAATLAGIITDEIAIGVVNNKTTAVRIIPVPGKGPGESFDYGGLLGVAQVQPVNSFSCDRFVGRGGQIPAPLTSLRN
ncbi:MAG: PFL family protein [Deltaproteobacteria bacterium]|nr:PFL family protein [Deltaproteobacteria bacterium]